MFLLMRLFMGCYSAFASNIIKVTSGSALALKGRTKTFGKIFTS